ncbi:hypothetical protein [Cognatilysobacter lacus]|uniref:Uncharacterized protein n=1 Tax=Cognatilysobacter lacus TaxID=1643323 RepID=A0A5D8Z5L7_9GAMM|nr:hypothetical protein [Lysobacter lacus]TZF90208.1 hypothetical protein FW784_06250 [Lysobacter lacus]
MTATVVGLVTPHLLRIVDLANQAEVGVNVDWHRRAAVAATMTELGQQSNAPVLIASYIDALEAAAEQAPKTRPEYIRVLRAAAAAARNPSPG